jgi:hypothetical protein
MLQSGVVIAVHPVDYKRHASSRAYALDGVNLQGCWLLAWGLRFDGEKLTPYAPQIIQRRRAVTIRHWHIRVDFMFAQQFADHSLGFVFGRHDPYACNSDGVAVVANPIYRHTCKLRWLKPPSRR